MTRRSSAMTTHLDSIVAERGSASAYSYLGESVSYRDLGRQVNRAAAGLIALGVQPGDRVALLLRNRIEYFILSHAIWRAGAVLVPVNVLLSKDEIRHVLTDSGAVCLVANGDLATQMPEGADAIDGLQLVVADREFAEQDDMTLADMMFLGTDDLTVRSPGADRLAIIAYTSGTTGVPKGAMLDDQHLFDQLSWTAAHLNLDESDNFVQFFPVHSVAPNLIGGWLTAFLGSECVIMERFDARKLADLIPQHQVTCFAMVPTMLLDLLRTEFQKKPDLGSMRYIQVGGAAVPDRLRAELLERFGIPMIKSYGSTECSYVSLDYPGVPPKDTASGQVLSHIDVTVRDLAGNVLPTGDVGEICAGPKAGVSPTFRTILGYWNDVEKTTEALAGDVFHTGDVGYVDEDGWVFIVDRVKDMIIRGGNNIYPAELERALQLDPRVDDAYVVGVIDARLGEIPKAFIVPSDVAGDVTTQDILDAANERLARFKRIEQAEFISASALPRSAMNKVLKNELRKRANPAAVQV
jgi:long-chain acyl-CoA synthetase